MGVVLYLYRFLKFYIHVADMSGRTCKVTQNYSKESPCPFPKKDNREIIAKLH